MDTPLYYGANNEYLIERLSAAHYQLLQDLFIDAFSLHLSLAAIQHRYDTTQLGAGFIGFIAIHRDSGVPAAHYGVFPVRLGKGEQRILAAQSADTMTHTHHRKKGLFVQLARLTFEACKQEGVQLVFGFPNANSYHGFIHSLDWQHVDNMVRYTCHPRVKTVPLFKIVRRSKLLTRLFFAYSRAVMGHRREQGVQAFHNMEISTYCKIDRDEAYLSYKAGRDKFFVRIGGVVCWIKLTDVLFVGDFDHYEQIDQKVLNGLRRLAFWLGYNTISLYRNESVGLPPALHSFNKYDTAASCFLFLQEQQACTNILFTGADLDTW